MKPLYWAGLLVSLLGLPVASHAQAVPMASRTGQIQVGAGFSFAKPDYSTTYIKGFTLYGSADFWRRLGVEADMHYISILTPKDIGENTFLIGPKFSVIREGRLNAYVKALGGVGRFVYQPGYNKDPHTDTFGVYSLGGGIEYRASQHLNIRAIDIEAQRWPNYGTPGFPAHGLSPFVTTFGAAYTF
ncbi:MAG TPA: outer membrane beta-barrel protein [Edaphobacter sp.]|nr:outer membrane beta-barrel protein [Edaphobacter sp.]